MKGTRNEAAEDDPGWIPWFIDVYIDGGAAERTRLQAWLKAHNIQIRLMYPSLSSQPVYESHQQFNTMGGAARAAADSGVFLPSATGYTNGTIDLVCELIRLFFSTEPAEE